MHERLCARGEPGPVDDDQRAVGDDLELGESRGIDGDPASVGAVRVGEPDVDHGALGLVDRVWPPPGAVHDLVGDDDGAGPVLGLERPDRAGGEDLADPDGPQRPEVRAVVDAVRREAVALAVAGDEGDAAPLDLTDDEGVARAPEGCVDLDRLVVVEELVEAGPADDADLGARAGAGTAGTAGTAGRTGSSARSSWQEPRRGSRPAGRHTSSVGTTSPGLRWLWTTCSTPTTLKTPRTRPTTKCPRCSTCSGSRAGTTGSTSHRPSSRLARALSRGRGGLGSRARVGLVEARALEGDADRVDHLAQPRLAALRTHRQGVVGERLADVEGVTALLARVGVGGHR